MKGSFFKKLFFPFVRRTKKALPDAPQKILVIRQDNRIGNLLLITPFLELCRQRFPKARVDVVVGGFFGEVLRNNPNINTLHVYDQLKFIRNPWLFPLFILKLRTQSYDVVFDMKPVFSFNNLMLTLLSGAQTRVGFTHQVSDSFFDAHFQVAPEKYEAAILADLLQPWKITSELPSLYYKPVDAEVNHACSFLKAKSLPLKETVAIHTGGRGRKRVALEDFLKVGERFREKGESVLFFFGPDEEKDKAYFESHGFVCVKPKTVEAFGGFLPHLKLFVSCDTGPMHLAAGAGVATIAIFIGSSVERYAPRGLNHKVVHSCGEIG